MKTLPRQIINGVLGTFGCRLINARWGPRGFADAFRRIRGHGIVPAQVVDVGASTGVWTRECMTVFPEAKYLLVDPLEENAAPLARLAQELPGVRVWRGALGAAAGQIDFYHHGDQSSPLPSEYNSEVGQPVPVRTLDSFLGAELDGPPGLIKLDVQGYEIEVLKGAEECLRSTHLLLVELSYRKIYENGPLAHEVISFLGARGFRIYDICTYAQRPYDGELAQSDFLFARQDSELFRCERWA